MKQPLTPAAYINSLKVRMATDEECIRQYGMSLQEWLRRWVEGRDGKDGKDGKRRSRS